MACFVGIALAQGVCCVRQCHDRNRQRNIGASRSAEEPPAGAYVMIAVTDTGSGMTQEVLAKAFEPFFTTKETGKGSGLGLSQVLGFAKQTGGGMRIDTRVGEGTSIKVYLARALQDSASLAPFAMVGVASGNRRSATILLVDDDSAVREVTASMLEGLGYVVLTVGSGGGALDLLERHTKVDLVLLDFAMPVMNGAWSSRARSSRNAHGPNIVRYRIRRQSRPGGIQRR